MQQHPQSTPQLTTLQHPAQLDSPLQHSNSVSRGDGETAERSPSPASSLYSASFHSDSSQSSSDEDREQPPTHQVSTENLNSSALLNPNENADKNVVTTDPLQTPIHIKDEREGSQDYNDSGARPALVTRGGVTIEYQLGPIPTTDSATQTDEQAIVNKSEPSTTLEDELPQDNVTTDTGDREREGDNSDPSVYVHATTTSDGTMQSQALVESPAESIERNDAPPSEIPTENITQQDTSHEPTPTDTVNEDVVDNSTVEVYNTSLIHAPEESTTDNTNSQSQQNRQRVTGSDGELDSISKSTLTQVSEKKTSASITPDSSRPPSPSVAPPDNQQTQPEHEPEETVKDDNTAPDRDQEMFSTGAEGHSHETVEHLCEEEFTKAWN